MYKRQEISDAQAVYTIKFSETAAETVKEKDIIKVQMADGTVLNLSLIHISLDRYLLGGYRPCISVQSGAVPYSAVYGERYTGFSYRSGADRRSR